MRISFDVGISVVENGRKKPEYRLENDLNGETSLLEFISWAKRTLIIVADDALRDEQSRGFDKKPVVAVDNIVGKPVIEVKPFGKIEFNARVSQDDLLLPIYKEILKGSKVVTGTYIESNFVFYNGKVVASNITEMETWAKKATLVDGDIVRFVNVMPYAGKLERLGVTAQRTKNRVVKAKDKQQRSGPTVRAPNGVYQLALRSQTRLSKRNSSIKFEWVNGSSMDLSGVRTSTKNGKPLRKTFHPSSGRKGSYVYPSIIVRIQTRGIL
jgi:hypothetical protein